MKKIAILGSTGSIGQNTLRVVKAHPERVEVVALAAGSKVELLIEQAKKVRPRIAAIRDETRYLALKEGLRGTGVAVAAGESGVIEAALAPEVSMVMGAIVGGAGLMPVYRALLQGRDLALANKETLVMAGSLMTRAARESGARIIPVDSEHNAIFQCLDGEDPDSVRRILLTASGGPFRATPLADVESATVQEALRHPTWKMGPKITIDSATLMNKGLEVIEAHFLFGLPADRIDVVIHPKSIVHSLVELRDGSILAELGTADMRIPIRYALAYPERWPGEEELRLDLLSAGPLEFFEPDRRKFPCIDLAYRALRTSSSSRVALNAANEVAVDAFLQGRIPFGAISRIIEEALDREEPAEPGSVQEVLAIDERCRSATRERLAHHAHHAHHAMKAPAVTEAS